MLGNRHMVRTSGRQDQDSGERYPDICNLFLFFPMSWTPERGRPTSRRETQCPLQHGHRVEPLNSKYLSLNFCPSLNPRVRDSKGSELFVDQR